uniref:CG-1 domain-containing protein n=1 Tax=Anopheles coluzzii TaxID=1518534 RepID=A0A8W7P518_ANOCL
MKRLITRLTDDDDDDEHSCFSLVLERDEASVLVIVDGVCEIAAILISFDKHSEWQSKEVKTRPKSGSMLLYSRKKVRYRRDGYCWKKRKDGKTTREDHMKLKVQGTECIYGCYVHSAILPTFHRRCYWLLQNPDIVLVHYLNVPYPDDNKMAVITPNLALWGDKKEWTKEELVSQLKPMFFSEDEPDTANEIEISTAETVEAIVSQLMEKQRMARQTALVKQLECGCPDANCADGKSCSHPMRRISAAKSVQELGKRSDGHAGGGGGGTAPNVLIGSRMYPRWLDNRRMATGRVEQQQQQQSQSQHPSSHTILDPNGARAITPKTLDTSIHFQVIPTSVQNSIRPGGNQNASALGTLSISNGSSQLTSVSGHITNGIVGSQANHLGGHRNENHISMIGSTGQGSNRASNGGGGGDSNATNGTLSNSGGSNGGQSQGTTVHHNRISVNGNGATSTPPLVLSLGQNLGGPGSLLILNQGNQQQSYVCQQAQHQKANDGKDHDGSIKTESSAGSVAKQEMMDASSSPVPSLSHHQQRQPSQQSNSSPSSATGGSSDKQSFDSLFGYQDHTPMASPVQSMESSSGGGGGSGGAPTTHHHDNLPFFNETLDLSQEDIQKTLSANMPLGGHVAGHDTAPTDDAMNGEINPMDFIENCGDNHGTVDDDVFVNLDAFDMLVEFPELELDAKSEFLRSDDGTDDTAGGAGDLAGDSGSELGQYKHQVQSASQQQQQQSSQPLPNASTITDFSPEWAYPEGGIKVLVTGPWSASSAYTVLFDSFPVPTTLVQDGVLRCYCPAHEVGIVTLQVACDGFVISNAVNFEYKSPPKFETKCEGNGNDMLYKFNLLNRLESIDEKLQIKVEPGELPEDTLLFKQNNFEDRLVNYCETLTAKMWRSVTPGPFIDKHQGMTLLHLAAALGYAKLVRTMLTWKAENSNVILEAEIDALSQDKDGYTPLTLACARGHTETAIILYKWNQNALNVRNNAQKGPVEVARDYGHGELARELERQEKERLSQQQRTPTSASIPTLASITYGEGLHGANSDSCSNDNFGLVAAFNPSLSPTGLSPYSEMKGSCSSTGSQGGGGLHYGLENTNSNPMLSNALSPNSDSNRSHDGVFLRPGAVYSSQSPPGARLSKRSSIDSGINMDNRSVALSRTGKAFREAQRTNRMDRSMSLPLASGGGGGQPSGKNQPGTPSSTAGGDRETDSFSLSLSERTTESPSQVSSNVSLLSPLRKMDFALYADSLQEDDCHHQLPDSMDMGPGTSGNGAGAVTNANESEETMYLGSPLPDSLNEDTAGMGILNDTFMEPLLDSLPSSQFDQEFNFEFSDHNYRYHDVGTPCSSLSPASSGPLQSPASYSIPQDHPVGSPSPPPTTQDFTEFLQSSNATVRPFEADFSNLKLNDREQRELYEAAKCIQKAYRSYKGRKSRMEEQDKERTAAVVIQNYYRRYKQYAYYRQMTQAALVIQNGYRSYCENKRFKKSQTAQQQQQPVTSSEEDKASAQCLETYYQNFRNEQKQQQSPQQQQQNNQPGGSGSKEPSPSGPLKRTYSQRTQNQAARKIQQFMRQSKNKLQRERAEKERLVHLRRVEYLQSLQCHEQPEAPPPTSAPR